MPQPSDIMTAASFVSLALLCVLGLRKLVLMEGLLTLRAFVLATPFWAAAFYLFGLAFTETVGSGCDFIEFGPDVHARNEF